MNLIIKPAELLSDAEFLEAVEGDYIPWASQFEKQTTPRWGSLQDVRDILVMRDPIFGTRLDYGWKPWVGINGDIMMFDGTVLYNAPDLRVHKGDNAKFEWRP